MVEESAAGCSGASQRTVGGEPLGGLQGLCLHPVDGHGHEAAPDALAFSDSIAAQPRRRDRGSVIRIKSRAKRSEM
jgi:hypothetical protein